MSPTGNSRPQLGCSFYAFKEGDPGEDATRAGTAFLNAVDAQAFPGTAARCESDSTSAVTFDADSPGAAVYSSSGLGAELLCEDPQSVCLSSARTDGGDCGGCLSFEGVGNELSRHHDTGFTLEFFFRMKPTDVWHKYASTFELDAGYLVPPSAYSQFKMFFPCDNDERFRYGFGSYSSGVVSGSANVGGRLDDDKWHHLAFVQTADKRLRFYFDGSLRLDGGPIPSDQITCVERTDKSVALRLGMDALCGKFSCVRLVARELEPADFMAVSSRKPEDLDAETVAFYPFDDGRAGSSAVGTPVCNAVAPLDLQGTVSLSAVDGAAVTFDAEAPGRYVFKGAAYRATPYYVNPGSLRMTADVAGSGSVSFSNLATELSKHHDGGYTVEYFFKMEDSVFSRYTSCLSFESGLVNEKGNESAFNLFFPFDMSYGGGRQFRYSWYNSNYPPSTSQTLPYDPWGNGWHHVAVVEDGGKVGVFVDYVQYGEVSYASTKEQADGKHLVFGNGCHHGKYSCLKVTKRALSSDEFLRASNCETCWPSVAARWRFDGPDGEAVGEDVDNAEPSFQELNPGLFHPSAPFSGDGKTSASSYSGRTQYRRALVDDGFGAAPVTNGGCVRVVSTSDGATGWRYGDESYMDIDGKAGLGVGDFTAEGFFRFDEEDWISTAGAYARGRPRLTLMSLYRNPTTPSPLSWALTLGNVTEKGSHSLTLKAYTEADGLVSESVSGPFFADGKWHHAAVAYDALGKSIVAYYDYRPVVTIMLQGAIDSVTGLSWSRFHVGYGPSISENVFHGWVDEVRYSRDCLTPDRFIRQARIPSGMSVIIR